jgi:hypothetical protein
VNRSALLQQEITVPAATFTDGHLTAGHYLVATLAGPEFTATADCESAHSSLLMIAPTTFTLTIGDLSFTVVNHDPVRSGDQALRGCDGQIELVGLRPADSD